jgi:N-acetylneuraminate synthase
MTFIEICGRKIGKEFPPFVIVEIGINHEGDIDKAKKMIKDAHKAGAECIKFQCHIIDDEMIENNVIPQNSKDSIWEIMDRCSFNESQEFELKCIVEELGMIYLNTPFSRKAVDRLEKMNVCAYKIGSGECNNYPLIEHIVNCKKPIILSTGMNNLQSISKSVKIIENAKIPYAILHTTSMYPTPYEKVRLGALTELELKFPNTVIGLSDHSIGNYTSFASVALGASILEKHFTSDQTWDGPDIPISINPDELKNLIFGSDAIHKALGGKKEILPEEKPTINFAYASVVSIKNIMKGEVFSRDNIWVKRPGTGEIRAKSYKKILKKTAKENILKNTFLEWSLIEE